MMIDKHTLKRTYIIMIITYSIIYICALAVGMALFKYPEYENVIMVAIMLLMTVILLPDFQKSMKQIEEQFMLVAGHIMFSCVVNMVLAIITFAAILTILVPVYIDTNYLYAQQFGVLLSSFMTCGVCGITLWFHRIMGLNI